MWSHNVEFPFLLWMHTTSAYCESTFIIYIGHSHFLSDIMWSHNVEFTPLIVNAYYLGMLWIHIYNRGWLWRLISLSVVKTHVCAECQRVWWNTNALWKFTCLVCGGHTNIFSRQKNCSGVTVRTSQKELFGQKWNDTYDVIDGSSLPCVFPRLANIWHFLS